MPKRKLSRRRFLVTVAASTLAMPHVRGAFAAGRLTMGFWDHWVPGANSATTALVNEWAEKEKVEVSIDYIPSQGNKLLITITAEAQAGSGHDILAFPSWQPADHANRLEPMARFQSGLLTDRLDLHIMQGLKTRRYRGVVGYQLSDSISARFQLDNEHSTTGTGTDFGLDLHLKWEGD